MITVETSAEMHERLSDGAARTLLEMTMSLLEQIGDLDEGDLIDELNTLHAEFADRNLVK